MLNKENKIDSLTIEQYSEILKFIQKYHKFALYNEEIEKEIKEKFPKLIEKGFSHGLNIKYIDSIYDSRDGKIWSVTFRRGNMDLTFSKIGNLYEVIMEYLTTGKKPYGLMGEGNDN